MSGASNIALYIALCSVQAISSGETVKILPGMDSEIPGYSPGLNAEIAGLVMSRLLLELLELELLVVASACSSLS